MECKEYSAWLEKNSGNGFNRDIVECKAALLVIAGKYGNDLIETLWNVKEFMQYIENMGMDGI